MAYKRLNEFIDKLEQAGELVRIKTPVSAELEITEITDRVSKLPHDRNKALLFEMLKAANFRWPSIYTAILAAWHGLWVSKIWMSLIIGLPN